MLPFPLELETLVQRFDTPPVRAIVLMGSYARGEAGSYSDIDIARFTAGTEQAEAQSFLVDGYLVVVNNVTPQQVEECFHEPEIAIETILGLRSAQILLDRDGYFAAIQRRAEAFAWDQTMQERANSRASALMVGWIEEVHKGLVGLQQNDIGRLLNARHGFSWGLNRVMRVQRGILVAGDNRFYDALAQAMGPRSEWMRLHRSAFGIENEAGEIPALRDQVRAGLRLYVLTAELLEPILQKEDRPLIAHTVQLIRDGLS